MGYTPQPSNTAHLISLREAVERGHGGYSTLRAMIADGRLPAVKIGGRVKVTPDDLAALARPTGGIWQHKQDDETALEAAVEAVVARAPKLSPAQSARLALILGGAS